MASDRNRAWKFWAAGIVVALVLVGTIVGILLPTRDGPGSTARPTATPPSASPVASDGCDMPESDSTAVPADIEWESSGGVSWPQSASVGPTAENDGFATCFERSPRGAALAGATMLYSMAEHEPADAMAFYVTDSPGRSALLAAVGNSTSGEFVAGLQESGVSLAGFNVLEYSPERATIQLVSNAPRSLTGFHAAPLTLVWVDGDWRLKPQDDGSLGAPTPIRAGQFIAWGS